jgi:hypothetical protein
VAVIAGLLAWDLQGGFGAGRGLFECDFEVIPEVSAAAPTTTPLGRATEPAPAEEISQDVTEV